jgi:hypothetical protein
MPSGDFRLGVGGPLALPATSLGSIHLAFEAAHRRLTLWAPSFWSSFGVPLAGTSGAGRLEPRLSLVTFEAFRERRLFAANIGAGAMVHDDVEVVA